MPTIDNTNHVTSSRPFPACQDCKHLTSDGRFYRCGLYEMFRHPCGYLARTAAQAAREVELERAPDWAQGL